MSTTIKMPATLEVGTVVSELPFREIYLHPGQMYVSNQPVNISMILGSCAGVCVYDRLRSIGGATHYMLPEWDGSGQPSPRYGDLAIDGLLKQFQAYGSKTGDLEARIFGGACMFAVFRGSEGANDHIGSRNVGVAVDILSRLGINIVARDTGGENGRKLKMQSDTGIVLVSLIRNS